MIDDCFSDSDSQQEEEKFEVLIHYNNYNAFDEWISEDSPRIALFRTHTKQPPMSSFLSPFPLTKPKSLNEVRGAGDSLF
jgi:hypothetical protein